MSIYATKPAAKAPAKGILETLASIKLGGGSGTRKIRKRDLIFILRNIATLTDNGLSLPKALETLVKEKSLKRYSGLLGDICREVEQGSLFSTALARYKDTFGEILVSQVRIGEKSGTLPATLERVTSQLEHADNLKGQVIKKLSYPALLCVAGTGAVTFMLLFVIPTFEKTYKESGAKLPGITQFLIDVGRFASDYGLLLLGGLIAAVVGAVFALRNPVSRYWIDRNAIRVPMIGECLRSMAVLQFMEVLGNLMEAGFTLADALLSCARAVKNRAVRHSIEKLHGAVLRGERFSQELEKYDDLFPPVVKQLIVVGEKTGSLSKATVYIRAHLRREVERYTSMLVGAIEPILTLGLAFTIGGILLAIYLPMFDMIGAMNPEPK